MVRLYSKHSLTRWADQVKIDNQSFLDKQNSVKSSPQLTSLPPPTEDLSGLSLVPIIYTLSITKSFMRIDIDVENEGTTLGF
jgi:hypothetical protein